MERCTKGTPRHSPLQTRWRKTAYCKRIRTSTHKIAIGDSDLINVRFCPLCGLKSDICRGPRSARTGLMHRSKRGVQVSSIDHLVGARVQYRRNVEVHGLGGLEVNHQLERGRLHPRQVGGLGALENAAGIDASLAIGIGNVSAVA